MSRALSATEAPPRSHGQVRWRVSTWCAARPRRVAGGQAEGVTAGIQQHQPPPVTRLSFRLHRATRQRDPFGRLDVLDAQVQVALLGHLLTGPPRGPVPVDTLEAQVPTGSTGQTTNSSLPKDTSMPVSSA